MTTDDFHVKLDDDHFYGILQIELACMYTCISLCKEEEELNEFFIDLILSIFRLFLRIAYF